MKSKQKVFLGSILFFLITSMSAFSQIKFGVKAGVDLENPTFSDAFKVENLTSYAVGPTMEAIFPFSKVDFGIDVALLYSDNRMTVSNLRGESDGKISVSNRYLTLPLNAKLKLPLIGDEFKLYGTAGPYAGYLISGDKIDFPQIGDDIKAKAFEGGINLGFGFELFRMVQLGANYKVKLTDNYSLDKPEWNDPLNGKSQTWSINLAVLF